MTKANPNDFLLNTDYEMDKIILFKTGSFVSKIEIANDLSFTPLIFGVWSTSPNFTTTNPLGDSASASEYGYTPPTAVDCIALANKLILTTTGKNADSQTIYYRLYAMAPPEANADTPLTSKFAKQFVLNTDYNYRKIRAKGTFTQAGQSFTHALGYYPQVMAWIQYKSIPSVPNFDRGIQPILVSASDYGVIVTTSEIKLPSDFPFSLVDRIIWRVYYDEA